MAERTSGVFKKKKHESMKPRLLSITKYYAPTFIYLIVRQFSFYYEHYLFHTPVAMRSSLSPLLSTVKIRLRLIRDKRRT